MQEKTATTIAEFEGEHEFLSNFYPAKTEFEGDTYATSEHAFQAAKTDNPAEREKIRNLPKPGSAKQAGRKVTLRRNWDIERIEYMKKVLESKFSDPELRQKLLDTGEATLIEGNNHGDTFWGVCRGGGQNRLGKILMQIRTEIRQKG
jgi:ribA/ribD-fused uncharacterized protein